MLVGRDQADLFGHSRIDECFERPGIGARDDARHDIALAADLADHGRLAGAFATANAVSLVPGLVVGLAASYAGDWVTRSIRRRGEPAFR